MPNSVDNVYSSALFELLEDENANNKPAFETVLSELKAVGDAFSGAPEFVKLSLVPTVSREDKLGVIKNVFGGKVSPYVLNFLCVLSQKGRLTNFDGIYRGFRARYHEKFGITPVTVTSPFTLTKSQRDKIVSKMEQITGKKVELSEKTDKNLIGGVVLDYGGSRIDGSVKTRLETLKKEIADIVM